MSESVILCEGYHDRAFWAGWLEHLGCKDPGKPKAMKGRLPVTDPWGVTVGRGQFGFLSPGGGFVRIIHCDGKDGVLPAAESRIKDRGDKRLRRLVLCVDADTNAEGVGSDRPTLSLQAVEALMRRFGQIELNEHGDLVLERGEAVVSIVRWQTGGGNVPGCPTTQTLERLVCAALVAVYPERGPAVQRWLDSRPDGHLPAPREKEFAWSHMAGWYAQQGCDAFFRVLWEKELKVVAQLEARLRECGAWRVAEALAD